MNSNINLAITRSIPISKDLKRYLIKKWNHLCLHNGERYASDVFADVKTVLLAYRSDPARLDRVDKYLTALPIRKNGWARRILQYMDSQPSAMLNFVKLYTSFEKPLVTVEEAAIEQENYLNSRADVVNASVPNFLAAWLEHITKRDRPMKRMQYKKLKRFYSNHLHELNTSDGYVRFSEVRRWIRRHNIDMNPDEGLSFCIKAIADMKKVELSRAEKLILRNYASWPEHTYDKYRSYWIRWRNILKPMSMSDGEAEDLIGQKPVLPDLYKDFFIDRDLGPTSRSAIEDLTEATWLWHYATGWYRRNSDVDRPGPSRDSLLLLSSVFNRQWRFPGFNGVIEPTEGLIGYSDMRYFTPEHGRHSHVGHVHYIPKKGTIKRRPIAVPNRYLQQCLMPVYTHLARYVRRLPRDCTFDQSRLDTRIQNRVNNENLYVGSVDLSQATDNLPLAWGMAIMDSLIAPSDAMLSRSRNLFIEMSRSSWVSREKTRVTWTVGQPLGTLPSFMLLSLTHNLFLESLAFGLGFDHSPYAILGDDVVIFNKKLRRNYIREMTNRGIPLSLHKSYSGNLTEFAGKTYIKNMRPFYTSDHSAITFESLFDYSRATGLSIPWNNLPRYLRNRIANRMRRSLASSSSLASDDLGLNFSRAYSVVQQMYVMPRGSFSVKTDTSLKEIFNVFCESLERVDPEIDPIPDLRWFSGHPIQLGHYRMIEKHGHMLSIRDLKPNWFQKKFRPVATDRLLTAGHMALMELKHQYEMGHISDSYQRAIRGMWSRILG